MAKLDIGELQARITVDKSRADAAIKETKKGINGLSADFKAFGSIIGTALSVESARRVIMFADNFRVMNQRIETLSANTKEASKNQKFLNDLIQETGASINDTVSTFQRFKLVEENIGLTNDETLKLIETLQKLGVAGGSTTEEMSNGLTQLAQGFAGGVIRAEEFNSIMENLPLVAKTVANEIDGVNGDLGKLRELMLDGRLDSKLFADALLAAADDANEAFQKVPKSIGTNLSAAFNSIGEALNNLDDALGITEKIASAFGNIGAKVAEFSESQDAAQMLDDALSDMLITSQKINRELAKGESIENLTKRFIDLTGSLIEAKKAGADLSTGQITEVLDMIDKISASGGASDALIENLKEVGKQLELAGQGFDSMAQKAQAAQNLALEGFSNQLETSTEEVKNLQLAIDALGAEGAIGIGRATKAMDELSEAEKMVESDLLSLIDALNQSAQLAEETGELSVPMLEITRALNSIPDDLQTKYAGLIDQIKAIFELQDQIQAGTPEDAGQAATPTDTFEPDLSEITRYEDQIDAEIELTTAKDRENEKRLLALQSALGDEQAAIDLAYAERLDAISELEGVQAEEILALKQAAWDEYNEALSAQNEAEIEKQREHLQTMLEDRANFYADISSMADSAYSIIGTIGQGYRKKELKNEINAIKRRTDLSEKEKDKLIEIAKKKAEEETIIEKAAFFAKQMAAIASIIVDTQKNVAAAGGYLTPTGIAVGLSGAAQVATVVGTAIGGGRIMGGDVFEGQAHRVGETAPEMVIDKAGRQFLIPSENGSKVKPLDQGGMMGGNTSVNIINNTGVKADAVARVDQNGEIEVIIERAQELMIDRVVDDIYSGEGAISTAIRRMANG